MIWLSVSELSRRLSSALLRSVMSETVVSTPWVLPARISGIFLVSVMTNRPPISVSS